MKRLVAISGGIGAGKSIVSRILETMGYPVYDCDSEAKRLMDSDVEIHRRLCLEIHHGAVTQGRINRQLISDIVFSDAKKLEALNAIVHGAVTEHLMSWRKSLHSDLAFVETAILNTSGLWRSVDACLLVEAPIALRISRVQRRSGLSASQIESRIAAQQAEAYPKSPYIRLINDDLQPLQPQIQATLLQLSNV